MKYAVVITVIILCESLLHLHHLAIDGMLRRVIKIEDLFGVYILKEAQLTQVLPVELGVSAFTRHEQQNIVVVHYR